MQSGKRIQKRFNNFLEDGDSKFASFLFKSFFYIPLRNSSPLVAEVVGLDNLG